MPDWILSCVRVSGGFFLTPLFIYIKKGITKMEKDLILPFDEKKLWRILISQSVMNQVYHLKKNRCFMGVSIGYFSVFLIR